jgi:hypothetical protein
MDEFLKEDIESSKEEEKEMGRGVGPKVFDLREKKVEGGEEIVEFTPYVKE